MRVHVNRWKHRMYDTVPDIQDTLTTDATETWIHACDWRVKKLRCYNKIKILIKWFNFIGINFSLLFLYFN